MKRIKPYNLIVSRGSLLLFLLSLSCLACAQRSAGYLSASLGYAGSKDLDGTPMGELKLTIPVTPYFHMGIGADYIRPSGYEEAFCPVFTDLVAVLNPHSRGEKLFLLVQPGFTPYSRRFDFTSSSIIQRTRGGFCFGAGVGTWMPVSKKIQLSVQPKYQRLSSTTTRMNTVTHERTSSSSHGDVFLILFGVRI